MIAIYKKELKQYFYSVTGSIFVSVNLFVLGIYFLAVNLLGMSPSIAPVISGIVFILMMMVPILTMRIMSEERKQKTDELLLTSPVSVFGMVLAKYLSLLTIFLIPVGVAALLPPVISSFGDVSYGESYAAILGYFLYGAACLALGLFISSLVESQISAAVLSFIALFVTNIISGLVGMLTESGNKWLEVFNILDLPGRLENSLNGILSLKDGLYFLSFILLFLFFTVQAVEKRRYTVSKATLSLTAYSSVSIVALTAVAILVNYFAQKIPTDYSEYDTTKEKLFTLTEDSKKFISGLNDDITIYVMGKKESLENYGEKDLEKTLDQYAELSSHIHVVYKDPAIDPSFAEKYTDQNVSMGSIIVVSGERSKVVTSRDLYVTEMDYSTYSETRTGYDGEGQITSAISFVTDANIPKLYVITGHEEYPLSDFPSLSEAVKKLNLENADLNLMQSGSIPEDAGAVAIFSPKKDFSKEDADAIKDYLKKGGKVIATYDYTDNALVNYESIFESYGVTHVNGLVLEGDQNHMYQSPVYLIPDEGDSVLTTSIKSKQLLNLFPQSSGFKAESTEKEDFSVEEALLTTNLSYAKKEVNDETTAQRSEGDESGPFALALYISDESTGARAALFGTSNIFVREIDQRVGGANVELFTNALNSMTDREVNTTIPPKSYDQSVLTVPFGSALMLGLLFILAIPLAILISGIVLFWRRRRL